MSATAVVINAGLGDLTLGLQSAGFNVVADYETDEKALKLHKMNFSLPAYSLLKNEEKYNASLDCDRIDFLAARFYKSAFFGFKKADPTLSTLQSIISRYKPRMFLLILGTRTIPMDCIIDMMQGLAGNEYQYQWTDIDIGKMTGFPVVEHKIFAIGQLSAEKNSFHFPVPNAFNEDSLIKYLDIAPEIDPWYFKTAQKNIPVRNGTARTVYCWKNHIYQETPKIYWNYIKLPLVWEESQFRKITHREIISLKGFPKDYLIPNDIDKQWLYKTAMTSCNILAIEEISTKVFFSLKESPWKTQRRTIVEHFQELFMRYLSCWKDLEFIEIPHETISAFDIIARLGDQKLYFDLKIYRNGVALRANLKGICQKLSSFKVDGSVILVVANEIPDDLKEHCWESFHIAVWDVSNLLWAFENFPEINNEFISLLDYTVEEIEKKAPYPNPLGEQYPQEDKCEEVGNWKGRLNKILPGKGQFAEYEALCVDILKYILSDYLTLWAKQEQSNDGLYRFDLCCKIKNGAEHDFFDTIRQYFNTKYIVFEFKNYSEKITQKEIYTTEKYLFEKALRKVAIIISRQGADEHALQAAKGSLRENGKLILCLSDSDLLQMSEIKGQGEAEAADFLSALLDDFLVHLEK